MGSSRPETAYARAPFGRKLKQALARVDFPAPEGPPAVRSDAPRSSAHQSIAAGPTGMVSFTTRSTIDRSRSRPAVQGRGSLIYCIDHHLLRREFSVQYGAKTRGP